MRGEPSEPYFSQHDSASTRGGHRVAFQHLGYDAVTLRGLSLEAEAQPIVNILGEKVALGPMRRCELPVVVRWLNDFEVLRTTSQVRPMVLEALEEHFDRAIRASDQVHFSVYERASMRLIGGANLTEITGRTATFAILIGDKDCWGKGYGTEVTQLVLDYGFNALGLRNILLTVHSYNERGIRAYLRAGFQEIGRRRAVIERGGQLHDLVYVDCLASEFESPHLRKLLMPD
jgi:RimJ/RimL family protein N-acetyltransferase